MHPQYVEEQLTGNLQSVLSLHCHSSQTPHQIKGTNLVSIDFFKAGILSCLSFNFQF